MLTALPFRSATARLGGRTPRCVYAMQGVPPSTDPDTGRRSRASVAANATVHARAIARRSAIDQRQPNHPEIMPHRARRRRRQLGRPKQFWRRQARGSGRAGAPPLQVTKQWALGDRAIIADRHSCAQLEATASLQTLRWTMGVGGAEDELQVFWRRLADPPTHGSRRGLPVLPRIRVCRRSLSTPGIG